MNIKSIILYLVLAASAVFSIASCKKSGEGNGAPVITRVRTVYKSVTDSNVVHQITLDSSSTYNQAGVAAFDSTTTDGQIGTLYAIIGENLNTTTAVYLNGVSIYFNPAYLSNTTMQITIPSNVPYSSSTTSNVLTVVNPHGRANFNFIIEQPQPIITTADQLAGNPGDVITLTGTTFNGLSGVSFGTIPGTVVSSSPTEIKVKVPSGVTAGRILVTTVATKGGGVGTGPLLSAGTSELSNNVSASHQANGVFGFSTPIFEDQFESGWYDYGWSNSPTIDQTVAKRGTSSIKVTYGGGYDAFVLGPGTNANVGPYTALKFSIYGGKGTTGKLIRVSLNYNFNVSVQIILTEGAWTDYIIPIANLVDSNNPLPSSISAIVFQEFSGNASVFNIDDIGLVDVK